MEVSGQLYPSERDPGTHCTVGWVGPRAGLDVLFVMVTKFIEIC
jgi:hypothetical protein